MKTFIVEYFQRDTGVVEKVEVIANSQQEIIRNLINRRDIILINIKEKPKIIEKLLFLESVPLKEIADFCYGIGKSLEIGIDILSALNDLQDFVKNRKLKSIIRQIIHGIRSGRSLSDTMSDYTDVFSPSLIGLVKIGERTGALSDVLLTYASYLDWIIKLRAEVKKALAYPILVFFVVSIAITVLITFVLPKVAKAVKLLGLKEVPLPTQIIISLSENVKPLFIGIGLIIGLFLFIRLIIIISPHVRFIYDKFILKLPLIGRLLFYKHISEDLKALADMYKAGSSILEAFELVYEGVENNLYLKEVFEKMHRSVSGGITLSEAFKNTGIFPPLVIRSIKIGEDTGDLDEAIYRVVEIYQTELKKTIESMAIFIEPALQLFLGLILGLIAVGVLMPVYEVISKLGLGAK